jgi:hypothetical protein
MHVERELWIVSRGHGEGTKSASEKNNMQMYWE